MEPTPDLTPENGGTPEEPSAPMPRWVPIVIGAVLVVIAALAVITGMRYRSNTLTSIVRSDDPAPAPRANSAAPPGEPDAGASLVSGHTPEAKAPVTGSSRAVITGGPGGVTAVVRIWAKRGMIFDVTPRDAVITVNGLTIGQVSQFDSNDEIYDFPQPGSYDVRVSAPGFAERHYIVTAAYDAPHEIASITAKLDAAN